MKRIRSSALLTLPLDAPAATLAMVGGKGQSLARLASMGLQTPPGFHIITDTYRRFVASNDLQAQIMAHVTGVTADDPGELARASAAIQALFAGGVMPDEIASAIRRAYADLGGDEPAVAVRSSATAEDLSTHSFAGQHETYLNVQGEAAVLDAVRRCWASLWTAQAIGYRARLGIEPQAVAMGVVVQKMVAADVAGIMFTVNPTTGDRTELVVNASYGLGEAIVSGAVIPDTYVLDRITLIPKTTTPGAKTTQIIAAEGQGVVTASVPTAQSGEMALALPVLRELAALGLYMEQYLGGAPLDIEWAVAQGRCWILQARPITNLPPVPLHDVRWAPPSPGALLVRRQVTEHMPDPLSPLFEDLYLRVGLEESLDAFVELLDNSASLAEFMGEFITRPFFVTVNGYAYSRAGIDFRWKIIPLTLRIMVESMPELFRRWLPYWRDEALPRYQAAIARWQANDSATASDASLLDGIQELAVADARYWFAASMPLGMAKMTDDLLNRFLIFVPGDRSATGGRRLTSALFLRGFPSPALAAEAELEAIAQRVQDNSALRTMIIATPARRLLAALATHPDGQTVLDDLQRYFDRYGHQIYNLDFVEPTLADAPLPVLISLKSLVENPEYDVYARQAALVQARQAQEAVTIQSLDPLRRWLFRRILSLAQRYAPYREEALFYVGAAWPTLRRLALELGQRLVDAGTLAAPDDVFFLVRSELEQASMARANDAPRPELGELAHARRNLRDARKRLMPPTSVPPDYRYRLGPLSLALFEPQAWGKADGSVMQGFAVSPGRVTARASVIQSPADFDKMGPGAILVCHTTTPAWTPLLAQARGLVTNIGGVLAHGSIVAREYGIPAVMGVSNATQRIAHGQQITVDGDAGTVILS